MRALRDFVRRWGEFQTAHGRDDIKTTLNSELRVASLINDIA
jgi:hypothetical protein